MDDLISRKALIETYCEENCGSRKCVDAMDRCVFISHILEQPTVEAVPVVHCKDCDHWGTGVAGETEHVKCCEYGKYMVGENGYCCYADMRKKVQNGRPY